MCRKEKRTGGGVELNMAKELGHMARLSWSKIDRMVDIQSGQAMVDSLLEQVGGVAQGGTALARLAQTKTPSHGETGIAPCLTTHQWAWLGRETLSGQCALLLLVISICTCEGTELPFWVINTPIWMGPPPRLQKCAPSRERSNSRGHLELPTLPRYT